jgi:hypothetical protein
MGVKQLKNINTVKDCTARENSIPRKQNGKNVPLVNPEKMLHFHYT